MYKKLYNHIKETYPPITDGDFSMIIKSTSLKEYKKKCILWKEGEYVKLGGYVVKGCFRYYITNEDGHEYTTQFAMDDWWVGDMNSMLHNVPSKQNLQSLEDSTILQIEQSDYKNLIDNCSGFRKFIKIKRDRAYEATVNRLADINESAEARYENLMKLHPDALFRLPLYHIASYLGITPESLSRLRKKLASSNRS